MTTERTFVYLPPTRPPQGPRTTETPLPRPKASEQRDTRGAIVDAALELFAERGYHGTSVRDIARAVGVRESTLYGHFAGKDALLDAVLFATDGEARPLIGPPTLPSFDGAPAHLRDFLAAMLLSVSARFVTPVERKRFKILLSDGLRLAADGRVDYQGRMLALRKPIIDLMRQLLARGLVRGTDAETLSLQFVAPMMAWRQLLALMPEGSPLPDRQRYIEAHIDRFLFGCAGAAVRPALGADGPKEPACDAP